MRRLILFRHAKAEPPEAGREDHERRLAPRGRRTSVPMGAWLAGRGFRPDLILCSTAARTRETLDLAQTAFLPPPPTRFEDAIYAASADALLALVRQTPADVHTLMIVGHNPGLEQFVELLACGGDPEARRTLSAKFPTAGIAVLDFPADSWAGLEGRSGRLDRFVSPKALGIGEE